VPGDPVGGADVRLLGAGLSTITDSTGRFEFQCEWRFDR